MTSSVITGTPVLASSSEHLDDLIRAASSSGPSKPLLREMLETGRAYSEQKIRDKVVNGACLLNDFRQGDLTPIAGFSVDYLMATLTGQQDVLLLGKSSDEYNEVALLKSADALADHFLRELVAKDGSSYGVVRETGQHVSIYQNKSVTRLLAESVLPGDLPLRNLFLACTNVRVVDNFLRGQIVNASLKILKHLVRVRTDMTLKEVGGKLVVGGIAGGVLLPKVSYDFMTAESETDLAESYRETMYPIWEALGPYVVHELRSYTKSLVKAASQKALDFADSKMRAGVITLSGTATGVVTYGLGTGLEYVGPSVPYIGLPLSWAGSMIKTNFPVLGYVAGGFFGDSATYSFKSAMEGRLDNFADYVAYLAFDYQQEEHALFGLNPDPSDVELALFRDDYELRRRLRDEHYFLEAIQKFAQGEETFVQAALKVLDGGARNLLSYFVTHQGADIETALNETETRESMLGGHIRRPDFKKRAGQTNALRCLLAAEGTSLKEDVTRYPSYAVRIRQIQSLEAADALEVEKALSSHRRAVETLEYLSWELGAECTGKDDAAFRVLLELTPFEQDLLIEIREWGITWDLKEMLSGAKLDLDKEEDIDTFKRHVKQYIAGHNQKKMEEYSAAHSGEIESLRTHSLGEGASDLDLVTLHKALQLPENASVKASLLSSVDGAAIERLEATEHTIIQGYYQDIVAFQKGRKLGDILKDNLITKGVVEKVKASILEEITGQTPDLRFIQGRVGRLVSQDPVYQALRNAIKATIEESTDLKEAVNQNFNDQRRLFLGDIVHQIMSEHSAALSVGGSSSSSGEMREDASDWELISPSVVRDPQEENLLGDALDQAVGESPSADVKVESSSFWNLNSWWSSSPSGKGVEEGEGEVSKVLTDEGSESGKSVEELALESLMVQRLAEDLQEFKSYDRSSFGRGLINLIQVIKEIRQAESSSAASSASAGFLSDVPEKLSDEELRILHAKIHETKEARILGDETLWDFYKTYQKEILTFKSLMNENPEAKKGVFYGLKDVIEALKAHNQRILNRIIY